MTMNYADALAYLYGLTTSDRLKPTDPANVNLDRIRALLAALGNPHEKFKSVHITGTKGKGSSAAMMAACLRAMGLRVGLFTSPHLHTFRERVRINGELVSREDVVRLATDVKMAADQILGITTFEAITALGFTHFARSNVDWAVVEVGLGGRFDPTNVITPRVCNITSISYDHTQWLGSTLTQIAYEKAGIIKPGVPVVSHSQPAEATIVIERVAKDQNAKLICLGRHWRGRPIISSAGGAIATSMSASLDRQIFDVKQVAFRRSDETPNPNNLEGQYDTHLLGMHQVDNATGVIAAIDAMRDDLAVIGPHLQPAVQNGLHNVRWPGRFEVLRADPPLVIDGAHNVDSVNKLATALAEMFAGKRWTLIFGCYKDKDAEGMIRALAPRAIRWIMVQPDNPRALPLDQLMALAKQRNLRATLAVNAKAALESIKNSNEAVCVVGSLTLAGEARAAWLGGIELDTD